jgi:hypothetical protein
MTLRAGRSKAELLILHKTHFAVTPPRSWHHSEDPAVLRRRN